MTDRPERNVTPEHQASVHRLGSAWTDRGTRHLVAGDWAASVDCHRRAVALLGGLPVTENQSYLADLGAAWVNLGCALREGGSPDSLGAFDRAVALLGQLPHGDNPRFGHNLAAAWMNRADALAHADTDDGRAGALPAYGRAIEIAGALPLDEKPSFRILLASCWINLGALHQRLAGASAAVEAYDAAIGALGCLPAFGHRMACHHAATARTNRGEMLLAARPIDGAQPARESARSALAIVEGKNLDPLAAAKLSLRALRVMARSHEVLIRTGAEGGAESLGALTDIAERGLELAFEGRVSEPEFFDPFIVWFFSFGSRTYGQHQPQFLAEFLDELLRRADSAGGPGLASGLRAVARQAAAGALEGLGRSRLLIEGTPQTNRLMATVSDLRHAAAQL
jgi:hypothetical protein